MQGSGGVAANRKILQVGIDPDKAASGSILTYRAVQKLATRARQPEAARKFLKGEQHEKTDDGVGVGVAGARGVGG